MTKQKLIILRGYPGSGKTALGKLLSEKRAGKLIDHNSILTFLAEIVGGDDGIYDEIHILEKSMAKKLLRESKDAIVARGFSSQDSIKPYLDIATEVGAEVLIFKLIVTESNLKIWVSAEARKKDFNPTVNEDALLSWIRDNPLEDIAGEYKIDADKPIEKVTSEILSVLSP